ncbi:PIG-L family deacetylase [Brachybacterium sp. p3-SID957]|uniref:PIG-L family deacetylase n=1 Tax=Brachybacterium sp. p3-SID957 TaxID=2916049 RepID=UPI00223ADE19|nr:PIG-L family deacetylase [Brachybacterium sp. p3-SID957]MCT1774502.1 PIG-L family deacetylase [Brachybacterium sp. p3-SID957]
MNSQPTSTAHPTTAVRAVHAYATSTGAPPGASASARASRSFRPSRRSLLRGGAALTLASGVATLGNLTLSPAEKALADGTVDLDLLYIGAHPDDEAWALAAFGQWNEYHDQQAGVITITRGEGGGNAVGLEEGPALGMIREAEERTAVGIAGIEHVFNLDAVDFYYTLSAPLSRQVWGDRAVLSRIIRVIRATRPEVIVTMNPSAVEGNHGNHQQAAMYAVEAYLLAGRDDVFPEHFEEGLRPFAPARILRSGSNGKGANGPDAVEQGYKPDVPSDVVFGAWNGTESRLHGKRWSELLDESIHTYATQGWHSRPPSSTDPAQIRTAWFTLIDSRTPLVDATSGDEAALRGATLPIRGGLPLGTRLEVSSDRFAVLPGEDFTVEVTARAVNSAIPKARVELEVPEGWSVDGDGAIGTIAAKRSTTATFTLTPPADAATGEAVLLRAVLHSNKGSGHNVLPLRVAGPVEAGLADRDEIAQFLEWTEQLGMQRLDALVPTRRSLGSGLSEEFELVVRNFSTTASSAEVEIDSPPGIMVTPRTLQVEAIPAGDQKVVTVTIENTDPSLPTANRAPNGGVYPVDVRATSSGITATREQGLHLVPRLVASPSDGVEVDAQRGTGEYPDDPIDIGTLWEGQPVEPADAGGCTWVTYDDEAIHVFVHVVDDVLGAVLPVEDNKQRFRTDSIEIMIDPRGDSDHTATTFILGVLPQTLDADGSFAGPAAGRDHDGHQGPIGTTAPSVQVASHVREPYDGYDIEVTIPFAELPNGIDPARMGFNVVAYDSDTQDKTGQSRIGWSTFPGVQADPYRWGVLELPELDSSPSAPEDPVIPDTGARSVESPQSIIQSSQDGVGLGGYPALPAGTLRITEAVQDGATVRATVRAGQGGTLRAYLWDGEAIVGTAEAAEIGSGTRDIILPVTGEVSDGTSLVLVVSLENEEGNAAASRAV